MSRRTRIGTEVRAATRTFLRRRTAVMFTFVFPLILVVIFGALISTEPGGGGLFTEEPAYYLPGYLAVVVLFTPLSRLAAEVIRQRMSNRFEKLATTPLTRWEWLLAHTLVTAALVTVASVLIVVVLAVVAGTPIPRSPLVLVFIVLGVGTFSGIGAILGRIAGTQDGAIAAANTLALPLLFLAETFIPPALFPEWFQPVIPVLPLTPFTRGVRSLITGTGTWMPELAYLTVLAVGFFAVGAAVLPRSEAT